MWVCGSAGVARIGGLGSGGLGSAVLQSADLGSAGLWVQGLQVQCLGVCMAGGGLWSGIYGSVGLGSVVCGSGVCGLGSVCLQVRRVPSSSPLSWSLLLPALHSRHFLIGQTSTAGLLPRGSHTTALSSRIPSCYMGRTSSHLLRTRTWSLEIPFADFQSLTSCCEFLFLRVHGHPAARGSWLQGSLRGRRWASPWKGPPDSTWSVSQGRKPLPFSPARIPARLSRSAGYGPHSP